MINGKRIVALIPARGGSKGVPGKNIRPLAGKPLIAWTIEAAKQSQYIDSIVLSSEDPQIIATAKQYGCEVPFIRPSVLAQDDTPGIQPVLHAMTKLPDYDYLLLLQVTSPLRTVEDIDGCIEYAIHSHSESMVSVSKVKENPYWMYTIDNGQLSSLISQDIPKRRQDLPDIYQLNGALYLASYAFITAQQSLINAESQAYVMPCSRSIDIDDEIDFATAEQLIKSNHTYAR